MNRLSVLAIPAAIALVFVSAASAAQDKPNAAAAKKSGATVNSLSKPAKATVQAPTPLNSTATKAQSEHGGAKQSTPAAIGPASERGHEDCRGKDSDA